MLNAICGIKQHACKKNGYNKLFNHHHNNNNDRNHLFIKKIAFNITRYGAYYHDKGELSSEKGSMWTLVNCYTIMEFVRHCSCYHVDFASTCWMIIDRSSLVRWILRKLNNSMIYLFIDVMIDRLIESALIGVLDWLTCRWVTHLVETSYHYYARNAIWQSSDVLRYSSED